MLPEVTRVSGARHLKRAIQQVVENPLAEKILNGSFMPGHTITVDVVGKKADVTI